MKMQRGRLFIVGVVAALFAAPALAVDFGVEDTYNWFGYMNVFELPENGGGYVFGSAWGPADLPATFVGNETLELGPNTNTYQPGDNFWVDPNTGAGNKWMEANFYVEDKGLLGQTVNFDGMTVENTLVSPYESFAFIKVLDPNAGWSAVAQVTAPLVTGQPFNLSLAIPTDPRLVPQFGFTTLGPNAAPDHQFGHVLITPEPTALALLAAVGLLGARRR